MDSPSPVPPAADERAGSARKKRSNTRSVCSGVRPGPWSTTSTAAPGRPSRGAGPTRTSIGLPAGVWVRALREC